MLKPDICVYSVSLSLSLSLSVSPSLSLSGPHMAGALLDPDNLPLSAFPLLDRRRCFVFWDYLENDDDDVLLLIPNAARPPTSARVT
jgi:hypothetical protein